MGNRITVCHWDGSGHWDAIEISTSALNGHDNHDLDIWAPVEGVTPGHNWPQGETIYLNGCVLEAQASPSPTPSPTSTLPDTGMGVFPVPIALLLMAAGLALKHFGRHR
jgi:hypothetical protein